MRARHLFFARPAFEAVAVGCSLLKQEPRSRKAFRIAPYSGESRVRLRDEVLQVALPTATVVAEEQQISRSRNQNPPGEMDGSDRTQESRFELQRAELTDHKQNHAQRDSTERLILQNGVHIEMVLSVVILPLHYVGHLGAGGIAVLGKVRLFGLRKLVDRICQESELHKNHEEEDSQGFDPAPPKEPVQKRNT